VVSWLTQVFKGIWKTGHVPDDWRKGIILPFYKGKGSRQDCKNYRGITLLSCPGKVFAHLLLVRVKDKLLSVRRPEQGGFTPQRSAVDRIALLNLLLQGRREHARLLWIDYVDLRADAFDSVDRTALWALAATPKHWHISSKLIDMFKNLYTDTVSCVRLGGELSDWFLFGSGVRQEQGCTVAPSLFLLPVDWGTPTHKSCMEASLGDAGHGDLY